MNRKLRAYSFYQEYLFLIANDLQVNVTKMNIVNDFLTSFNNKLLQQVCRWRAHLYRVVDIYKELRRYKSLNEIPADRLIILKGSNLYAIYMRIANIDQYDFEIFDNLKLDFECSEPLPKTHVGPVWQDIFLKVAFF